MINIDLSSNQLYKTESIVLNKTTFIYGKNGSGKSTFADIIKKQYSDKYNIQIFNGFDGILDKNKELNAVVLGKENVEINELINKKNIEIKNIENDITLLRNDIIEPEQGKTNLFTKKSQYEKEYINKQKEIDAFCSNSASKIKNQNKPQIAPPSYNKNNFCEEIENSKELSKKELDNCISLIKSEVKSAKHIVFPSIDINKTINDVNSILLDKVEEEVKLDRLNSNEKINYARMGLNIHKVGDICAFCGNAVTQESIDDLNKYFSVKKSKELEDRKIKMIESIDDSIKDIDNFSINLNDFYSEYHDDINALSLRIEEKKKIVIKTLNLALSKLSTKSLFSVSDPINDFACIDFNNESKEYDELVKNNNSNDLEKKQEDAKTNLRRNLIHEFISDFNYKEKSSSLIELKSKLEEVANQIIEKKAKIDKLMSDISNIKLEIIELEKKTISETILVDNIKDKLKSMVNFELIHTENGENKGIYKIKSILTNEIRDIDKLSKGERNIVAFLYFIEKINEISEDKRKKIIIFDDPMTSNDDDMQYLIMEELIKLVKNKDLYEHFILLTHNKYFYLNVGYNLDYKKIERYHFLSNLKETSITKISNVNDDFKTGYESLWAELKFLYKSDANANLMLNPIRRILDTFISFNSLNRTDFFSKVSGAKKYFDVNSHEIYDLQVNENAKSKEEILSILELCFTENDCDEHFNKHWNNG